MDAMLDKIRNLLAKAESSEFTSEAEAFFAKAAALMEKYSIDQAMIWAEKNGTDREKVISVQMDVGSKYANAKTMLAYQVAISFGTKAVVLNKGIMGIVGFKADVEAVEMLVTSLLLQMEREMLRECPSFGSPGESKSWRHAFMLGFSSKIHERLKEVKRAEKASMENEASVALVLRDRSSEVSSAFKEKYPRVVTRSVGSRNSGGYGSGQAAGGRANLARGSVNGSRGALTG